MSKRPQRRPPRDSEEVRLEVIDETIPGSSHYSSSTEDQSQPSDPSEGSLHLSEDQNQPSDPLEASPRSSEGQNRPSRASEASPRHSEASDHTFTVPGVPRRGSRRQTAAAAAEGPEDDLQEPQNVRKNTTPRPRAPRRGRRPPPQPVPTNEDTLFNQMKTSTAPLKDLAVRWAQTYGHNPQTATAELLEFFLHSSNCSITITQEMLPRIEETLLKISTAAREDPRVFPLTLKTLPWPKFTSNVISFIRILLLHLQETVIYDNYLLKTIKSYLKPLTTFQIRSLRHGSTLILLKIMTTLEEIDGKVKKDKTNLERELDSENKKNPRQRLGDRLGILHERINVLQENRIKLNSVVDELIEEVFIPRCPDVLSEIRQICLEELENWLEIKPIKHSPNLRFIGTGLFDTTSKIKIQSLKILQKIYADDNLRDKLEVFNNRFKKRICAMVLDKDAKVGVEACKLMKIIFKNHREVFDDEDYEKVTVLVICDDRELAQASGDFLMSFCSRPDLDASGESENNLSDDAILKTLATFFKDMGRPEHAAFLVDGLIDDNKALQNWKVMTNLLLGEDSALNEDELLSMVKIMVASVQISATGGVPDGRKPQKKSLTNAEKQKVVLAKDLLTEHFIKVLPRLLMRFRNDEVIISHLLKIPKHFYLDMFVQTHQEEKLKDLLDQMKTIIESSTDSKVLGAASESLGFLCSEHPKRALCQARRGIIVRDMSDTCKEALEAYKRILEDGGDPGEHDKKTLVDCIKKVALFNCCHDTSEFNICARLYRIIQDSKESPDRFPKDAIIYTIQACFYNFLCIRDNLNDQNQGEEARRDLKEFLDRFIDDVKIFIQDESWDFGVREQAFCVVCDLLITFRDPICEGTDELMEEIVFTADENLKDLMNRFIKDSVFIDDLEDDFRRRRVLLASFCKVISVGVFRVRTAADVIKHYHAYYKYYGDIIENLLERMKWNSQKNWALTMQLSLNILYDEGMDRGGGQVDAVDRNRMIEVAKKFAVLFGNDPSKYKDEVAAIHIAGIDFVVKGAEGEELSGTDVPLKIGYLEVLMEFSGKLTREGKESVLKFLDVKLPVAGECEALMRYRRSLGGGMRRQHDDTGEGGRPRQKRARKSPLNVSVSQDIGDRLRREDPRRRQEESGEEEMEVN